MPDVNIIYNVRYPYFIRAKIYTHMVDHLNLLKLYLIGIYVIFVLHTIM